MPVITQPTGAALSSHSEIVGPHKIVGKRFVDTVQRVDSMHAGDSTTQPDFRAMQWQVDATAAIAELMSRIASARQLNDAYLIMANSLREFLGADIVAVASVEKESAITRLRSVSDVATIDESSHRTAQFTQAMSEAVIRYQEMKQAITVADPDCNRRQLLQIAHDGLLTASESHFGISCPLLTNDSETNENRPVAVWTAVYRQRPDDSDRLQYFARASQQPLGESLAVSDRACEGSLARTRRRVRESSFSARKKACLGGLLAVAFAMAIPIPHRIGCLSVLQPTGERFAVAPHDGILEQAMVRAGESVQAGQVLAEMDATDLQLQIADLTAQKERAEKKRDIHQASGDAASTQLAQLETDELAAQLALLRYRADHRRIVSKIDGVVLQSELDEARGVPVRTGDVLMQVAPLDWLRAEIEIEAIDLSHVQVGQSVRLIADGNPLDRIQGVVDTIRPSSEVREGRNVFVAEVMIDNQDGRLRPGMKGRAKIDAGYRASGWVIFHHAIEKAYGAIR